MPVVAGLLLVIAVALGVVLVRTRSQLFPTGKAAELFDEHRHTHTENQQSADDGDEIQGLA